MEQNVHACPLPPPPPPSVSHWGLELGHQISVPEASFAILRGVAILPPVSWHNRCPSWWCLQNLPPLRVMPIGGQSAGERERWSVCLLYKWLCVCASVCLCMQHGSRVRVCFWPLWQGGSRYCRCFKMVPFWVRSVEAAVKSVHSSDQIV